MKVTLPDGSPLELPDGATGADAARAIGEGLARAALGVRQNGDLRDLDAPLAEGPVEIVTAKDPDALWLIRHDAAHVLATAVLELYPGVKISIGPPIEDGFYYDFEFPEGVKVSDEDFERIEAKMREHIAADEHFERTDVPVAEAIERFRAEGQDYKVELIEDLVRRPGRRDRLALPQRPLHRPLPRPARPRHQAHQGVQADQRRRRLLARRRRPPDAHPHLRHRLPVQGGPRGAPASGSSRRAPATTASSAASCRSTCCPSCRRARPSGCRAAPTSGTS